MLLCTDQASCCLVAESDFFIGIDSCMLHVADMARVPGVGLFGPTSAKEFGFYIGPNITIQADGSMEKIEVDMVTNALDHLVAQPAQTATWLAPFDQNWSRTATVTSECCPMRLSARDQC